MKKLLSIALILGVAVLPACKKTDSADSKPVAHSVNDIKVPEGFLWENSHDVNLLVTITDERFGAAMHGISIYDGDPYNGGNLLAKGSASITKSYENKLHLSKQITSVYVVKTSPDNSRIINILDVSGASSAISFSDIDRSVVRKPNGAGYAKTTAIDCNSGCTSTITSNTNNLTVNSGDVICVTGSNITVNFSGVNGTVRVCGSNVTLQNLSLNGSASLRVSSTGSVNMSNFNVNSSSATVENEGTVTINGSTSVAGTFINKGTYNVINGDFSVNSSSVSFVNDGTMNVGQTFNNGTPQSVNAINNGTINANKFHHNSSSTFINNCSLFITDTYDQTGNVENYKLIKVSGKTTLNSGELKLYNGAMFFAAKTGNESFITNIKVKGYGSTSLVKIAGNVTVNGSGEFNSNVQVSVNSSVNQYYPSKFTGGADTGSSVFIAQDGCNSIGNGTPTVTDTDNDGAPDNIDDYPNDPTRAYDNYYPSRTGMATAAFEDQWPAKGDYDLNDLVMSYRYKIVTNATHNVVEVNGTYKLFATGGSYMNAFGVQFPVDRANVSGLAGGELEGNQTKAVVVLFRDMRSEMANWNTKAGTPVSPVKEYTITFAVSNGAHINTFGLSGYNPFIWHAGDSRGGEIHLPGQRPTDLANTGLFGTADDNSSISGNRYYLTTNGLPYAIEIPESPFNYPYETVDITQAFLHFADWAQSAGSSYTDWYSNTAGGYRNNSNIYHQ